MTPQHNLLKTIREIKPSVGSSAQLAVVIGINLARLGPEMGSYTLSALLGSLKRALGRPTKECEEVQRKMLEQPTQLALFTFLCVELAETIYNADLDSLEEEISVKE